MYTSVEEQISCLVDEYINKKGIVVKWPFTIFQKIFAILRYADDLEDELGTLDAKQWHTEFIEKLTGKKS